MPCSYSRMSDAFLQFSGSPTNSGTIWVSLDITGKPAAFEDRLDAGGAVLVALALPVRGFQMADRGRGSRADRRRQRGGEDEARRVGADGIDHFGAAGDIAAEAAEGLGEGAFENIDAMHDAVAFGNAAAARAVHADRMNFIDIGHGAVALGEVADFGERRDVAIHRIKALAGDQLGPVGACGDQQFFQMRHVAVAENLALAAGLTDALDHRIVVERVR